MVYSITHILMGHEPGIRGSDGVREGRGWGRSERSMKRNSDEERAGGLHRRSNAESFPKNVPTMPLIKLSYATIQANGSTQHG